jgi:hypothetical protein
LPLRSDLVERERRLFRQMVQAAQQRLVLSYARLDPATGAARLPSLLLLEFAEAEEGRRLDYEAFARLAWCERVPLRRREPPVGGPVLSLQELDDLAIASLPQNAARRYVRQLGPAPGRGLVLEALRNGRARFTAFDGMLADAATRAGLARALASRPFSASQLASYATCPFRFFMRHELRVAVRLLEPVRRDRERTLLIGHVEMVPITQVLKVRLGHFFLIVRSVTTGDFFAQGIAFDRVREDDRRLAWMVNSSMEGGIDRWSLEIDPAVPRYL